MNDDPKIGEWIIDGLSPQFDGGCAQHWAGGNPRPNGRGYIST